MPVPGRLLRQRLASLLLGLFVVLITVLTTAVDAQAQLPGPSSAAAIRYDVQGRGNITDLEEFAAAAAETYAHPRGWGAGGVGRFERVAAGADSDFTLWLAADGEMPSFGGACDHVWSCRSGRNVVVNEDRWIGASAVWNKSGAPLRDYRHMVVNHETGHWLGLGHQDCSVPGSPAAVMQQQSMGLQGCVPNAWPLAAEHTRADVGPRVGGSSTRPAAGPPAGPSEVKAPEPGPADGRAATWLGCTYVPWRHEPTACAR